MLTRFGYSQDSFFPDTGNNDSIANRRMQIMSGKLSGNARAGRGQGVVEYAGALIIAAIIVAAGIVIVPPNFAGLISTIYSTMETFFQTHLPG